MTSPEEWCFIVHRLVQGSPERGADGVPAQRSHMIRTPSRKTAASASLSLSVYICICKHIHMYIYICIKIAGSSLFKNRARCRSPLAKEDEGSRSLGNRLARYRVSASACIQKRSLA